jgi:hypothetical protein
VVEQRQDAAFQQALAAAGLKAVVAGRVSGLDYSTGRTDIMTLYRSASPLKPTVQDPKAAP